MLFAIGVTLRLEGAKLAMEIMGVGIMLVVDVAVLFFLGWKAKFMILATLEWTLERARMSLLVLGKVTFPGEDFVTIFGRTG